MTGFAVQGHISLAIFKDFIFFFINTFDILNQININLLNTLLLS